MTTFFAHANFKIIFGFLGNVVSLMVYLSPAPTFYKIYKMKSTQGFNPLPYAVALFSAMLTLYYGLIKQANGTLLITINSAGILIESVYLIIFMVFATKPAKWKITIMLLTFNVGLLGLIVLLSSLLTHGAYREHMIGLTCAICSICFFASPLCVIRTVIKTKSVEFMPFWLSFSLTICAVIWFFFGFFTKDPYVALPNVLGLLFGITQMALFFVYKNSSKKPLESALPATIVDFKAEGEVKVMKLVAIEVNPQLADLSKKMDSDNDNDDNDNDDNNHKASLAVQGVVIKAPEIVTI